MKIIAVEDDPVALAILEDALLMLGHEVITASNGAEAWDQLHESGCRVVVCDWSMPKVDGLDLCRRVRFRPGDYIYFILLTGAEATSANRDNAMEAGVDDFLSKPVDVEELKMRLHVAERILQYTTQIQKLEALIPICSYCKNIRDDQNYWQRIESYIAERTGAGFSHSICPDCYQTHVIPQFEQLGIKNYTIPTNSPKAAKVESARVLKPDENRSGV
ncbi:MAG: response regulator [Nibricoccus sp.]